MGTVSDGPTPSIPEGIYSATIVDITYVPPEQNLLWGKPQLKLRFKIEGGEFNGVELSSWVGMSLYPGGSLSDGTTGKPSNLYIIATAVMGEEPDLEVDFLPNTLMGGKLKIWIETKTSKKGTQYSRIVKYSPLGSVKPAAAVVSKPLPDNEPPVPEEDEVSAAVDEIPF